MVEDVLDDKREEQTQRKDNESEFHRVKEAHNGDDLPEEERGSKEEKPLTEDSEIPIEKHISMTVQLQSEPSLLRDGHSVNSSPITPKHSPAGERKSPTPERDGAMPIGITGRRETLDNNSSADERSDGYDSESQHKSADRVSVQNKDKGKARRDRRLSKRIRVEHKKNLVGEIIYKGHPSWVLMIDIQTGIRNSVGKSMSQHSTGILGPQDFKTINDFYASPKILRFPTDGSSQTIPHPTGPFKFKDYCPHVFRNLRHRFGIDPADYMVSLCDTQKDGGKALRELPTPGKSGSLFLFSHDMRFILKTIPKREAKLLRLLLPSYYDHVVANDNTLLPRFFGLHRIKPHKGRQVRFVVMGNVFETRKKLHERYDIKGSTLGRQAVPEELASENVTLKDLDFLERKGKIFLGPQRRTALLEQLKKDCKFLETLNIMDYSLLLGIHYDGRDEYTSPSNSTTNITMDGPSLSHNNNHGSEDRYNSDKGIEASDEQGRPLNPGENYYMGIIDILMLYSVRKRLEHSYKSMRFKGQQISAVNPNEYSARFLDFVSRIVV